VASVILITGASSGIGRALAERLHAKGDIVIGVSRSRPEDVDFAYMTADVMKPEQVTRLIQDISNQYDHIDALVNCAGVGTGGALEEVPETDFDWVMDVNVTGAVRMIRACLPMLKKTRGKIINVGSVAGEITIPYQISYSMSKSALHRLSEGLRLELKPFGVDVTTVLPGDTKTGFTVNRKVINREDSPYHKAVERSIAKMAKDEQKGVSPDKVARVIERLLNKRRMPRQRIVGWDYQLLVGLSRWLPGRITEAIVRKLYG